jgi:hypothetical protein
MTLFIDFSDRLNESRREVESTIEVEMRLVEYLLNKDEKDGLFPEEQLLERHRHKLKVR